jgi:hypothetical protein
MFLQRGQAKNRLRHSSDILTGPNTATLSFMRQYAAPTRPHGCEVCSKYIYLLSLPDSVIHSSTISPAIHSYKLHSSLHRSCVQVDSLRLPLLERRAQLRRLNQTTVLEVHRQRPISWTISQRHNRFANDHDLQSRKASQLHPKAAKVFQSPQVII